jgi:hypothetical protein
MSILYNPRHEFFAQAVASGMSALQAYVKAGYTKNDGNAIRLKGTAQVAARILELKAQIAGAFVEAQILDRDERVQRLRDRAVLLDQIIEQRSRDPLMADVPGGETGLICRKLKGIGRQMIWEYTVDIALLKELRETERQVAQELGEWLERTEITDVVPGFDVPEDASLEQIRAAKAKMQEALAALGILQEP